MSIRVVSNLRRFDSELASEIQFASLHEPGVGRLERIIRIIRECHRADVVFIAAPIL
ncbi:MAG TPA: hypothetical protein VMM79_16520 [Longimicrobiales bacterium]|nr:hypothetical protein [Longimicrobiales bacterium]